jgi:hypothetical protein
MPILPSTLEYTSEALQMKLDLLISDITKFKTISQQPGIELHVDLVYPQFAKARNVLSSLTLTNNLELISKLELEESIKITIHFMGELEDVFNFNRELIALKNTPKLSLELYVPTNMNTKMFKTTIPIFHWFDVDQYHKIKELNVTKFLLMTVAAGKSGQTPTPQSTKQALKLTQEYGIENVIVDGGWKINDCKNGLRMVSYSSFWNAYDLPKEEEVL